MMKLKWLYFFIIVFLASLVGCYFFLDKKFKDSNTRNYEVKMQEFLSENYDGKIYQLTKGVTENQIVMTIILNDGTNRVYDICFGNIDLKENYKIKKIKNDKYLYINGNPIDLYKYICTPNN